MKACTKPKNDLTTSQGIRAKIFCILISRFFFWEGYQPWGKCRETICVTQSRIFRKEVNRIPHNKSPPHTHNFPDHEKRKEDWTTTKAEVSRMSESLICQLPKSRHEKAKASKTLWTFSSLFWCVLAQMLQSLTCKKDDMVR